ncbi:MAG TPA: response regulator [Candidatus Acidoferrales bacterium]|nr:response regulator [Candidatus Acidoferrales bacterium]
MSDTQALSAERIPTVYFIDDSATMREVIKIAFRRESINVITCHDAASALAQFATSVPDVVITDVIMPDKDGYAVCEAIKQNPDLRKTPVILMSGVVNRSVAEKAIAVQADELIRKPFQPQDLITRVKNLLNPRAEPPSQVDSISADSPRQTPAALSGIFAPLPAQMAAVPQQAPPAEIARLKPIAAPALAATIPSAPAAPVRGNGSSSASSSAELQKLKNEIHRLEMLVRKLQSDLQAERQYVASLEEHLKTLQEAD